MALQLKSRVWDRLTWPFKPESNREAGSAVVLNFLLHWFPNRVTLESLAFNYSLYLGTITFALLFLLIGTGVILMFFYIPSVERAYWSLKDIDFAISFGWFLRRVHRISAHLMVAAVFLHMFRVFLTGSYKKGSSVGSQRPFNWVLGVVLLVLTLLLSFTGYLLPWDQLAYWAITVGTNIAAAVPLMGKQIREFLLGGTLIGQNTLIRFYVLHVAFLPLVLIGVSMWHMWRIRKDGGLAIVEKIREEAAEKPVELPKKTKTYSILGIAKGTTVNVNDPTLINGENSVPSSPFLAVRILLVMLLTFAFVAVLALFWAAPLEEPANPQLTPNPAKAPWYFLGLQELVGYSAFIGGVLLPGLVVVGLMAIPFLDLEQKKIGRWFTSNEGKRWGLIGAIAGAVASIVCVALGVMLPTRNLFPNIESQLFFDVVNPATLLVGLYVALYFFVKKKTDSTRLASIATFCAFIIGFILLTYTGTVLRGPNWDFFWPWQTWPTHTIQY